ncbi:MAG: UDP-N-acetylglucosamine 2-epimerase [Candidatus Omnitrophota bacterium]|nr:UDP-N-acetylglucosamine 2-epimerase (hydrolyzing) [Candidatus Omnitrophota bacterium]
MKRKRVCIVTGSRADWGLLYPLARYLKENNDKFILQIIAAGAHLSSDFGFTYKEIERDGFVINHKVKMPLFKDTGAAIAESVGESISLFNKAFLSFAPDWVFLLGDRFEIFSAAVSCVFLKIPIAHIHGGELTEGSIDDILRHAITKMSYFHFVSTDTYRKRVIQMGESPSRVFNVGALGIENIKKTKLLTKEALEKIINFKLGTKNMIVTFNPSTGEKPEVLIEQLNNFFNALDKFNDVRVIFTLPNPDMHVYAIKTMIEDYVKRNSQRCIAFSSMGRSLYLSALNYVDVVAGNSSSGIIEAPSFGIPTINIGDRQKGRVKALSVIDVSGSFMSLKRALKKAFSNSFRKVCKKVKNVYGDGCVSKKIALIITKTAIPVREKCFYDIKE